VVPGVSDLPTNRPAAEGLSRLSLAGPASGASQISLLHQGIIPR